MRAIKEVAEFEAISKITTCRCCYTDDIANSDLVKCSKVSSENQHLVCSDCITGSIKSNISEGVGTFACIFDNSEKCGGVYDTEILKTVLDADTMSKLAELVEVKEASAKALKLDNYQLCPFCSRFGCVLIAPAIGECEKCGKHWCATCRREDHGSRHCYELEFKLGTSIRQWCDDIDRMIHEIMTNQTAHRCPKCKSTFIKEEGCNKITCNKCHAYSCYVCGDLIPKEVSYQHFGESKGLCPLYPAKGSNIQYTRNQIHTELDKFVDKNDAAFQRIIIGRIENYYKMEKTKEAVEFIKRLLNRLNSSIESPSKSSATRKAKTLTMEQQAKDECKTS